MEIAKTASFEEVEQLAVSELLSDVVLDEDQPLVSQIFETVRRLIITVRLLPGQKISESALSAAFNASKTPVREALIRLEDAGLVVIRAKSGTFVSPIRIEKYFDAYFIRLQLETGAVRRAAKFARSGASTELLGAVLDQQDRALGQKNYDRFFALDEDLHQGIFEIAGISGAWDTARRAQTELYRVRHLKRICTLQRGPMILGEHQRIVEAIASGSEDTAEHALIAHIGSMENEADAIWSAPGLIEHIEKLNSNNPKVRGL